MTTGRQIRIFISSTFRDMQAERDELVKNVFPYLKQVCIERGTYLSVIDLRWGITQEQSEQGRVIPICLHEIDRCRPFFVALLGERYGWIPESISADVLAEHPWLREREGVSLTEIEIRHAVLNDPSLAAHAFFYFRVPGAGSEPSSLPNMEQTHTAKLRALKAEIRASGARVVENFHTAKEVATRMRADLEEVLGTEFHGQQILERKRWVVWQENLGTPGAPKGTPAASFEQLRLQGKVFSDGMLATFTGRTEYLGLLNDFVASAQPILLIRGERGIGKSALIANWSESYRATHPEACIATCFVGHPSTKLSHVLGQIARQVQAFHGLHQTVNLVETGVDTLLSVLTDASAHGGAIVVIDGLDQIDDEGGQGLGVLPGTLPSGSHVLLSSSTVPEFQGRAWETIDLAGLTPDERREMITAYLSLFGKSLDEQQLLHILSDENASSPLRLRTMLEELRVFGKYEELTQTINRLVEASQAGEFYRAVIVRLEKDYRYPDVSLLRDALVSLKCARDQALSEDELREILSLPPLDWSEFYFAIRDLLDVDDGLLRFRDGELADAVETRFLLDDADRSNAHLTLARYFAAVVNERRRAFQLPYHLAHADQWPELKACLVDLDLFLSLNKQDLDHYWAALAGRYNIEAEYMDSLRLPREWTVRAKSAALEIAHFLERGGFPQGAEIAYRTAAQAMAGMSNWADAKILGDLAGLLSKEERGSEATELYRQSVGLSEDAFMLAMFAMHEVRMGDDREAERLLRKALEVAQSKPDPNEDLLSIISDALVKVLSRLGRQSESY